MSKVLPDGTYVPRFDRHKKSAGKFSSMVNGVNNTLNNALDEVNHVNKIIAPGKNTNDLLTYNVIASNEAIESNIKNVQFELNTYPGLISGLAEKYDKEEEIAWINAHSIEEENN